MLNKIDYTNEGMAIIGVVAIAIIAMLVLEVGAKEIAIAIGSGLVGFIKGKAE